MIDARTKLFGLLGNPVGHSLSPILQGIFLEETALNGVYLAFAPEKDRLGEAVRGLGALGAAGVNVTIPYKEAVIPYLKDLTARAKICQAVNTLIAQGDGFIGDNTDGDGLLLALEKAFGWSAKDKRVLIVGAGGAAKGVAAALAAAGAKELMIANRTLAKAEMLTELLEAHYPVAVEVLTFEALHDRAVYQKAEGIINATAMGMFPHTAEMPPIAVEYIGKKHLVVDLIYNPLETTLLRLAKAQGATTISGLGMLIEQGALAFAAWTGQLPDTQKAYQVLGEKLRERNEQVKL